MSIYEFCYLIVIYLRRNFLEMFKTVRKSCLLLIASLFFTALLQAQDTTQYIISGRENSIEQQSKPYVILISADGYRHDLTDKYDAAFLKKISTEHVSAVFMKPSFPSLTFPNHYSIITGLYPSHHGLVANSFYDRNRKESYRMGNKKAVEDSSWYGGKPLWVLAEQQKMLSASFYWVGSESHIDGVDPTYYYRYNEAISIDRRIQILKDWLELPENKRPHFITFYFPEVDHAEHKYGTNSPQTKDAVQFIDQSMKKMNEMCDELKLPVNFIFLSDHGMINTDTANAIWISKLVDTTKFISVGGSTLLNLYAKDKKDIEPGYKKLKSEATNFNVYLSTRMPKRFHYGKKDDRYDRIGDIILAPKAPNIFTFNGRTSLGEHGYDNSLPEMQATFYAWGPAFKTAYEIGGFENVNVYPLIAEILGLKIDQKIDGKLKVLKKILK